MEASSASLSANGLYLFDKISVFDLIKLENREWPSLFLLSTYISTITTSAVFSAMPKTPPLDSIVLQNCNSIVLFSSPAIILHASPSDLTATRANMKNSGCDKSFKAFEIQSVYTMLGIIKLWIKFKGDLVSFIEKLNYSSLADESVNALESFIYSKAGVKKTFELLNIARNQQGVKSEVSVFRALTKPVVEMGVSGLSAASLDYTDSEDTEEIDELSFRVSELFKEKFPRFSAASITVMDTPVKEIRKSYLEYCEMIESPRCQLNNYMRTPIDSPKQSNLTIYEVKERLESVGSPESITSKPSTASKRNKFDFESNVIKSLNTELTGCSETHKPQLPLESKFRSCQCSSCSIM